MHRVEFLQIHDPPHMWQLVVWGLRNCFCFGIRDELARLLMPLLHLIKPGLGIRHFFFLFRGTRPVANEYTLHYSCRLPQPTKRHSSATLRVNLSTTPQQHHALLLTKLHRDIANL